ncbi:hypothetical protein IB292_03350 [Vibrio parahaemolyticus]|uniref:Uncharacterized protein n=1 Tax=Vibrio parahaemolyticus TaxID=670 RepID=A0A9Q3U843_VIBPH|nr:hypothetical protein [Vibrio parahaemolyticus]MCC3804069.1 hypothetical protein [Vibrio parahaemolyticus]
MEKLKNLNSSQLINVANSLVSFLNYSVYDSHQIEDEVALLLALEQSACMLGLNEIDDDSSVVIGLYIAAINGAVSQATDDDLGFKRNDWQNILTLLPEQFSEIS